MFTSEELNQMKAQIFIAEGLKDVVEGNVYDFDEAFDELERRCQDAIDRKYQNASVAKIG